MKKLLLFLILVPNLVFAAPQTMGQISIGFPIDATVGPTNLALSTATTYGAFGFQVNASETLSEVTTYYSGTTGTPTALGSTAELHTDTTGDPTAGSTETKTLAGAPSGAGAQTWTGYTTALTANTQYWIVFKNATATPASNFQTLQYFQNQPSISKTSANSTITGANTLGGYVFKYTTDGTTWSSGGNNPIPAFGVRLKFSSGRYLGYMFTNSAQETSNTVYAARIWGVKFTVPSTWPTMNVTSAALQVGSAGTKPASGLVYKIFSGSSTTPGAATCTSATRGAANISGSTGAYTPVNFASNCVLTANQTYRLVYAVQNASDGTNGNDYRSFKFTLENSAATKAQLPFGGITTTYSTDGTTFTDTDTEAAAFQIFLDTSGEFTVSASGGLKNLNSTSGGVQ